jgi:predicted RNase H-like nuclease (RuvC/YqgF family)
MTDKRTDTYIKQLEAEVASLATALTQKDEEFAAYKAAHEKCVEEAINESVRIHDEIEAKRDGIEAQLAQKDETIQQLQAELQRIAEYSDCACDHGDDCCALLPDNHYHCPGCIAAKAIAPPTPLQEPTK